MRVDEHISRFQVAVHDALAVSVDECFAKLCEETVGLLRRQRPGGQALRERPRRVADRALREARWLPVRVVMKNRWWIKELCS